MYTMYRSVPAGSDKGAAEDHPVHTSAPCARLAADSDRVREFTTSAPKMGSQCSSPSLIRRGPTKS